MRRGPWGRGRHLGQRSGAAAYGLALLGFLGLAGLHRFYLGRPLTGLLWLFTGGLCMLGTVADLLFMPGLLRDANHSD
ncbi:MAG: TM2 domain-containing membrane protein YozV [Myxococcota bacterium]|jgi:TM2 domain-containing membrane protein YozV